jgi:DNA-binding response OmpR family regulator
VRILLVEDDRGVAELIREALTGQHHLVELATDGLEGWELAEAIHYDLIVLDLMLPKLDGISLCQRLRARKYSIPILLLTAQDNSTNKVMGLDAGADDYVVKPFDIQELLARIRALLRRGSNATTPIIEWGKIHLNPSSCQVSYDGQALHLTSKEYALLELFLRNSQRIFSQSALLDHLWSFAEPPSENTVRAHIKSLRSKLKKMGAEDPIETVYGLGYRLKTPESKTEVAPLPTVPGSEQEQIAAGIAALWEKFKDKYMNRIKVVERALQALQVGNLTEQLRQQAQQEVHTLIGSLGSFGFKNASNRAREIEQLLQPQKLLPAQKQQLTVLVNNLKQDLLQPLVSPETPAQPQRRLDSDPNLPPRLLIVDDDLALAEQIAAETPAWGIETELAGSLSAAREAIARNPPNIILLDLCFPESAENGLALLEELATYQPPIPAIAFTAQESFADRIKVARLGGKGFLQKPIAPAAVVAAIAQVLEPATHTAAKLLIVDDDPQLLSCLHSLLAPWGFELVLLDDPTKFWEVLEKSAPDLLILDLEMPEFSGIDLCQVVRNEPHGHELPILFLSAYTDAQTVQQIFTSGADDYASKPIVEPELIARVLNQLERVQVRNQLRKFIG